MCMTGVLGSVLDMRDAVPKAKSALRAKNESFGTCISLTLEVYTKIYYRRKSGRSNLTRDVELLAGTL